MIRCRRFKLNVNALEKTKKLKQNCWVCNQCDQIGQFLKVLGEKFPYKVIQILGNFLAIIKTSLFIEKLLRQLEEQIGLLYILASGHTVCNSFSEARAGLADSTFCH